MRWVRSRLQARKTITATSTITFNLLFNARLLTGEYANAMQCFIWPAGGSQLLQTPLSTCRRLKKIFQCGRWSDESQGRQQNGTETEHFPIFRDGSLLLLSQPEIGRRVRGAGWMLKRWGSLKKRSCHSGKWKVAHFLGFLLFSIVCMKTGRNLKSRSCPSLCAAGSMIWSKWWPGKDHLEDVDRSTAFLSFLHVWN